MRDIEKLLKKIESNKVERREKDLDQIKVWKGVFDDFTIMTLYELLNKGYFKEFKGEIGSGKESGVFIAETDEEPIIVKIYRISACDFLKMWEYIKDDPRFNIGKNRRKIILAWAEKEYNNLEIAFSAGANSPRPIGYKNNVLMMEAITYEDKLAPKLKDFNLKNPEKVFKSITSSIKKIYKEGLVHGDISEYNILISDHEKPYLIDFSQGVVLEHPRAMELLRRDIKNIVRYFNKVYKMELDEEDIYSKIVK